MQNKTVKIKVVYSGYTISEGSYDRQYDWKILVPTLTSIVLYPLLPLTVAGILYQRKLPKLIEMELPKNSSWDYPYTSHWDLKRGSINSQ